MNFNERLRAAREHAKLTQQQLVEKLGKKPDGRPLMSQANLAKLEKNPKANGSIYSAVIAKVCGVNPIWLTNDEGEMVDGLYVEGEKIKKAVILMQDQPDYVIDEVIASINSMAKLTETAAKKTQK